MEQTGRMRRSLSRRMLLSLALTAALLTAYTALCAVGGGEIWPNVTALGVRLGGLDRAQAHAALERAVRDDPPPDDVGVVFQAVGAAGESRTVAVPLSAARLDPAATAERAWALGRELPFPLRGGARLGCLFSGAAVRPVYRGTDELDRLLDGVDETLGRPVTQTRWQIAADTLTVVKGRPGALLDRAEVEQALLERMSRGAVRPLASAAPQFTAALTELPPAAPDWAQLLRQVGRPVQNAVFDPENGRFRADRPGLSFDPAAAGAIFEQMDWGQTRTLPLTVEAPEITVADLAPRFYGDVLGECTTGIAGSANRVSNVALAASLFDGAVLMPGETFSYNDAVGSRTAARGFLPAPVYVSGQTVQETGGGVCQASSTLYLAALRADLAIVERYNHGYVPRYVPDGMDATVYYGVKDLKFRNDTPFPVKLAAGVKDRALTVRVLGTRHNAVTVEMTARTLSTTPFRTVYRVANDLPAGQTRVAVTPYTGRTVEVYRNRYDNGQLIETRLESTNVYRSRDKVVQVSPADRRKYGL